jgi:cytochrome P450
VACLTELIAQRRAAGRDDLLTALIEAHDAGDRLSQDELMGTVLMLYSTGQESTASHLTLSVLALHRHPDQWDRLVERPELVPDAVEELLRYVRLADTSLGRVVTSDVELPSGTVPAGAAVFVHMPLANRDPAVFSDPDRLDVTRPQAGDHLAFGQGLHYCLGAPLARLELGCALTGLVTRLPKLTLAVDESDLAWRTEHLTGGLRTLPVAW